MLRISLQWLAILECAATQLSSSRGDVFHSIPPPVFLLHPQYDDHFSTLWAHLVRVNTMWSELYTVISLSCTLSGLLNIH